MREEALRKVFEHAEHVDKWCAKHGGIRFMTALFGSQNYSLDNDKSDVDTKSVIIPDLNDWIWGDIEKYNTTIEMPDGSHAEVKAFPSMCKQWIKGNINFLETLYTEYVDIAPGWEWLYDDLLGVRDQLSRHNMYRAGKTWLGYLDQAIERAFNSTSESLGYRPECGYNPKSLMNAFRIKESFIRFFMFNRPFDEAIDMSDMRAMLLDVKENPMPRDVAFTYMRDLVTWMEQVAYPYIRDHYTDKEVFNVDFYMRQLCKMVYVTLGENEVCG